MLDTEYIEIILKGKEGLEFQKYSENFLRKKYGGDFQEVGSKGRRGDGGKDGYVRRTREYFAISSRGTALPDKIRSDFENCIKKNLHVEKFIFVSNQKIGPAECDVIDELQRGYPDIKIETMSHRHIAKELISYPKRDVLAILGRPVNYLEEDTVYFAEDPEKSICFTLWESIKDSSPLYAVWTALVFLFVGSTLYFMSEVAMMITFLIIVGLLLLYMRYNSASLKRYKFAHQIIYLILSGRLNAGQEVILNENLHLTIYWQSGWTFTIKRRAANCIKRGCNGKIYLYKTEHNTMIGRCERDQSNHTYNVDNNFYGELN